VGKRRARVDASLKAIIRATPTPEPKSDLPDPNHTYEITEVDTPPKQTTGVSASYPKDAPRLKSGQSVSVSGSFVVTASGDVVEIQIKESGGKPVDDAGRGAGAKRKKRP